MTWQDLIIGCGQFVLSIALLPSILGRDKPALSTSILTTLVLSAFALSFFSLGLWLSTISSSLASFSWFILGYQKYTQKEKD